jgi:hypothetical protein
MVTVSMLLLKYKGCNKKDASGGRSILFPVVVGLKAETGLYSIPGAFWISKMSTIAVIA